MEVVMGGEPPFIKLRKGGGRMTVYEAIMSILTAVLVLLALLSYIHQVYKKK